MYILTQHRFTLNTLYLTILPIYLLKKNIINTLLILDLNNLNSYDGFSKNVSKIVKTNGLNVLFNNAGISTKFTRLGLVKGDQMMDIFQVNTIAPIMLAKVLL